MVLSRIAVLGNVSPRGLTLLSGNLGLHRDAHLARHRDADLAGSWDTDLPWDRVAGLPGDLPGVLDRPLLALPLGVGVALRTCAVSSDGTVAGLCLPLAHWVTSVAAGKHLGVVTHNSGAVMHLLGHLVALLHHDVLAVFHVGCVDHGVKLGVADLVVFCVASLVVLSVAGSVGCRVIHSVARVLLLVSRAVAVARSNVRSIAGHGQG